MPCDEKITCTGLWKPLPRMVILVPPSIGPLVGVTEKIAGCWTLPPCA